ncbi:MBL fold metallo-hydrolase [Ramlibacter sp. XY19]|uniref:MBL fold metallo-hydrolase n=1 Tax=Ramlibacter paludis TaxID=2908000 RepID=UPI0023DB6363|nr:MBL fold metallo-hydrolase [Ramlibacter paludis]MCG2594692.1 MBL fold metallo-hydrolase [Ramlibacter paludis]
MRLLVTFAAALVAAVSVLAADPPPPRPQLLAPGTWLLPGTFPEGRLPDGNTVLFEGATGLVVMDTGRHAWHAQAILDFARSHDRRITDIVNSHWHLDHVSGNAPIRAAYPQAQVHTGLAMERMIREVWPDARERSEASIAAGRIPAAMVPDVRGDIVTREQPEALRPDFPVTRTETRRLDGVELASHFAPHAATETDVWLYAPASRIVAAGDLVTLPVPFLDTACVQGWHDALAQVEATPFVTLVPGHGAPMDRAQFGIYRKAFAAYTACAASSAPNARCAARWLEATAELRAPEPADDGRAREMAEEYVDLLRANDGNGARCLEPASRGGTRR